MKFPRYDVIIEINRSRQPRQSRSLRWNYILEIQVCFFKFDLPILSSNLSFVAIEAATSSKKGRAGRIRDLSSKELISAFNRIPALEKSFWRESLNLNLNTFLVSGWATQVGRNESEWWQSSSILRCGLCNKSSSSSLKDLDPILYSF